MTRRSTIRPSGNTTSWPAVVLAQCRSARPLSCARRSPPRRLVLARGLGVVRALALDSFHPLCRALRRGVLRRPHARAHQGSQEGACVGKLRRGGPSTVKSQREVTASARTARRSTEEACVLPRCPREVEGRPSDRRKAVRLDRFVPLCQERSGELVHGPPVLSRGSDFLRSRESGGRGATPHRSGCAVQSAPRRLRGIVGLFTSARVVRMVRAGESIWGALSRSFRESGSARV